jgi:hypothetical protein
MTTMELKTVLDLSLAFHGLVRLGRQGVSVSDGIAACLDTVAEMECSSVEDALAYMSMAQTLRSRATEIALETQSPDLILLVLEADKLYDRGEEFIRCYAGITSPFPNARRVEAIN